MERNVNTVKLYSLGWREMRTYLFAFLFIAGNIVLPQYCHMIPQGGLILLPIYFFTLVAAFRCGWKVGLLTAVLSPVVNCLLFGMPPVASLPAILIKSVTLVLAVELVSRKMDFSILSVAIAVLAYQIVGMTIEFLMDFNFLHAIQDIRIGWPGILIQIVGGYFVIKALQRR
jgi:hypothetical protein